jgi:hypothetical protein
LHKCLCKKLFVIISENRESNAIGLLQTQLFADIFKSVFLIGFQL